MSTLALLLTVAGAIGVLFFLIMGLKMHAFVALLLVSIVTAILLGIPLTEVAETVEAGMGGILGFVGIIVGLGAMIGQVLRVTGAAQKVAETLVDTFGERHVPWAMGLTGLVVALPVFFDVGMVLLISLVYALSRRLKTSVLVFALPLAGGLSMASGLLPPTPGPVAAIGILGADMGWVFLIGTAAALPAVAVGGVLYGRFIGTRVEVAVPEETAQQMAEADEEREQDQSRTVPGFGLIMSIILVPVLLILTATVSEAMLDEDHVLTRTTALVGHPITALLIALLIALYVLGARHGLGRDQLQEVASSALGPVGLILLVTGAGGVLGEVLEQGGVGEALEEVLAQTGIPLLLLAFLSAAVMRVALGSGTVAVVTAASIIAPVIEGQDLSAPMLAAVVTALGSGATMLSHVNDSGFWLVNKFLGMTERQTLQTWTVMQTIMGLVGFGVVLALSVVL